MKCDNFEWPFVMSTEICVLQNFTDKFFRPFLLLNQTLHSAKYFTRRTSNTSIYFFIIHTQSNSAKLHKRPIKIYIAWLLILSAILLCAPNFPRMAISRTAKLFRLRSISRRQITRSDDDSSKEKR